MADLLAAEPGVLDLLASPLVGVSQIFVVENPIAGASTAISSPPPPPPATRVRSTVGSTPHTLEFIRIGQKYQPCRECMGVSEWGE